VEYRTINSGVKMLALGFGVFQVSDAKVPHRSSGVLKQKRTHQKHPGVQILQWKLCHNQGESQLTPSFFDRE